MEREAVFRLGVAAGKAAVLSVRLTPPFVATAKSLYGNLASALSKVISAQEIPLFLEGVARGLVEARGEISEVLPVLDKLPGTPKFETTSSFTLEEVKEGKVFRARSGAGYRALNDAAQHLIVGIVQCFRERGSRGGNKS
jgi:hypothetical protein